MNWSRLMTADWRWDSFWDVLRQEEDRMCVALPGIVKEKIDDRYAFVDFSGNIVKAASGLVDISPGDRVLVHAGCIIQKVSEKEAQELEELFEELSRV